MKTFVIALIILTVLLFTIALNSYYISKTTDAMIAVAASLPQTGAVPLSDPDAAAECREKLHTLRDLWDSALPLISLTSSYDNIASVALPLAAAEEFLISGESGAFCAAGKMISAGLERIAEVEALTFDNFF